MVQAFLDINRDRGRFGNLHAEGRLYRVKGADPVYFRRQPGSEAEKDGTHYFLAITEKSVMDKGQCLSGEAAGQALLDGNAVLFDPSLQAVEPLKESYYTIDRIYAPGFRLATSAKAAIFENHNSGSPMQIVGISGGLILSINMFYDAQDTSHGFTVNLNLKSPGIGSNLIEQPYNESLGRLAKQVKGLDVFLRHMGKIRIRGMKGENLERYRTCVTSW